MEQVLRDPTIFPYTTVFAYYIVCPTLFALLLFPGAVFSVPQEKACGDGVYSYFSPARVTWSNSLVAFAIYILLLGLWFWFGSKGGIPFPFQVPKYVVST